MGLELGLANDTVFAISQSHEGYLFFPSADGLNRYDGYRVVTFHPDPGDATALSEANISHILVDRRDDLWLATWGGGLDHLQTRSGVFAHLRSDSSALPDDRVQTILEDRSGALWIGFFSGGLVRLNPADGSTVLYAHDREDPASLGDSRVWAIAEDQEGGLWLGTNRGVDRLDRQSGSFEHFPIASEDGDAPPVRVLQIDSQGTIWAGTQRGLRQLDEHGGIYRRPTIAGPHSSYLLEARINTILQDRRGRLWIGTGDDGLFCYEVDTGRTVHTPSDPRDPGSLAHRDVRALHEDHSGVLWIGTRGGGIDKLDLKPRKFRHLISDPSDDSSLGAPQVNAIAEGADGTIWVGTEGGGLDRLDRAGDVVARYRAGSDREGSLPSDRVHKILVDSFGDLWVGTGSDGLGRLDPKSEKWVVYRYDPRNDSSLSSNQTTSLAEDGNGDLWVGTQRGLNRFDRSTERFERLLVDGENRLALSDAFIRALLVGSEGKLWIGTDVEGLVQLDPRTSRVVSFRNDPTDPTSLGHNRVRALYEDRQGVLWVGTTHGLSRFDKGTGTFTRYGEPGALVLGIVGDESGDLWLSTNRGLARFSPASETVRNYTEHDGLLGNVFTSSGLLSADGRILLGGMHGMTVFRPDELEDNPHAPPVVLTGITVSGRPLSFDASHRPPEDLVLRHDQTLLSFELAALDFTNPSQNRFAVRVEGVDPDWVELDGPIASYHNLDSGQYLLQVRAANSDGVWNEEGLSFPFTVLPPWWATWWARLTFALGLLAMALSYIRLRTRGLKRHARELQETVEERTHELQEALQLAEAADRAKSEFLANVSHEIRTPLNGVLGMTEVMLRKPLSDDQRIDVETIHRSGKTLVTLVNDLLDLSKTEIGQVEIAHRDFVLAEVVEDAGHLLAGVARKKNLVFEVELYPHLPAVTRGDPERIRQILTNLISNAIKFTEQGRILVRCSASPEVENRAWIRLEVSDTGAGIPSADLDRLFDAFVQLDSSSTRTQRGAGLGLAISQRLAALMGGEIAIDSELGEGSTFTLSLPLEVVQDESLHGTIEESPEVACPSPGRVLLVEDHETNRMVAVAMLRSLGMEVDVAVNGAEAVQAIEERSYSLVLMDCQMPVMDGFTATREIRERQGASRRTAIVALTASGGDQNRVECTAAGMDDLLLKPLQFEELRNVLDRWSGTTG